MEHQLVKNNFAKKIIFTDEAHFQPHGYVNKQNFRIWGAENPRVIQEKPKHLLRVTVWCGFWAGGGIVRYFFANVAGNAVTGSSLRYRTMITDFFWPEFIDFDLEDMLFQQDGSSCHTAYETIELLGEKFAGRAIVRNADKNWPAISCDLTPCDSYLWGFLKSLVYANKPQQIPDLKAQIQRVIETIKPQLMQRCHRKFHQKSKSLPAELCDAFV